MGLSENTLGKVGDKSQNQLSFHGILPVDLFTL